jgi:hypothetical protein
MKHLFIGTTKGKLSLKLWKSFIVLEEHIVLEKVD